VTDQDQVCEQGDERRPADAGLGAAEQLVRDLADRPGFAFSNQELLANLRALQALAAVVDSARLGCLAALETRPEAVPGAPRGRVGYTFLTEALRVSGRTAGRDVAAAAALASTTPLLPRMGAALADGQVWREHVDVAVATLRRVPAALKAKPVHDTLESSDPSDLADPTTAPGSAPSEGGELPVRTGADVIDDVLTRQARVLPPSTVERLGRQIVHRLDPSRADRFDADAYRRRSCSWARDFAGMGLYRMTLDPATDVLVQAAISGYSAPAPAGTATTPEGRTVTVRDTRTAGQRRADAIAELILSAAGLRPTTPAETHPAETHPAETHPAETHPAETHPAETHPADPAPTSGTTTGDTTTGDEATGDEATGDEATGDEATGDEARAPEMPSAGPEPRPSTDRAADAPVVRAPRRPPTGVDVTVIATLDELAAAFGATDPAATRAGLARLSLAGRIGDYTGATLDPAVLARLACDSPLRRLLMTPHGAVLHHGRGRRLATVAQRRALAARDGGCVVPGCHAPPEWTDVHHVTPWALGGRTDIDQLVLLCGRHHTAHHAGVYPITVRDGIPYVRLPAWRDPARPWLRNTTHSHRHLADRAAARLAPDPPPPETADSKDDAA
jgi:hypothetical protein